MKKRKPVLVVMSGMVVDLKSAHAECPCGIKRKVSVPLTGPTKAHKRWMAEHAAHGEPELKLDADFVRTATKREQLAGTVLE